MFVQLVLRAIHIGWSILFACEHFDFKIKKSPLIQLSRPEFDFSSFRTDANQIDFDL